MCDCVYYYDYLYVFYMLDIGERPNELMFLYTDIPMEIKIIYLYIYLPCLRWTQYGIGQTNSALLIHSSLIHAIGAGEIFGQMLSWNQVRLHLPVINIHGSARFTFWTMVGWRYKVSYCGKAVPESKPSLLLLSRPTPDLSINQLKRLPWFVRKFTF